MTDPLDMTLDQRRLGAYEELAVPRAADGSLTLDAVTAHSLAISLQMAIALIVDGGDMPQEVRWNFLDMIHRNAVATLCVLDESTDLADAMRHPPTDEQSAAWHERIAAITAKWHLEDEEAEGEDPGPGWLIALLEQLEREGLVERVEDEA